MFKKSMALILSMVVLFGMLAQVSTGPSFAAVSKTGFKSVADVKGFYVISSHMAGATLLEVGNRTVEIGYRNGGEAFFTMLSKDPSEIELGIRVGRLSKDKKKISYGTGYEVYNFTKNKQGVLAISIELESGKITACKFKAFKTFAAANKFLTTDKTVQAEIKKYKAEEKVRILAEAKDAKFWSDKYAADLANFKAVGERAITVADPPTGSWKSNQNDDYIGINATDKKIDMRLNTLLFSGIEYEEAPIYLGNADGTITVTYKQSNSNKDSDFQPYVAFTFKNRAELIRIDTNMDSIKACTDIGIAIEYNYVVETN